jgi:hypothetical protein
LIEVFYTIVRNENGPILTYNIIYFILNTGISHGVQFLLQEVMTMTAANESKTDKVCGEQEAVLMMPRKECNILCVTLTNEDQRKPYCFHMPITGKAVIEVLGVQMGNTTIPADLRVTFKDRQCKFRYFRTGLAGTCVVIGVEPPEGADSYDTWELYTDQMTEKGKRHGRIADIPRPLNTTENA